jgi:hypothetical protein
MVANPIVFRSAQRREHSLVVVVEEFVGPESIVHTLDLDAVTFDGIERALRAHPFRRKRPEDDVVLFKSLDTPLNTEKKYLGLEIVNRGSRRFLRIEASAADFSKMDRVFWSHYTRMDAERRLRRAGTT